MADVNGFDPVPLSVDGGRHSAELFRLGLYTSTGGAEGVVRAGDCRVHALATPGAGVLIDAGALLIRNRSAGVVNQSYAANGRGQSRCDIPSTGTSPRSDAIIVRIEDEQYTPWQMPTGDRATAPRVKPIRIANVPANTESAADLNLGYSAYLLARVDIPANTTVITDTMVKNTRLLAIPKSQPRMFSLNPIAAGEQQLAPTDGSFMRLGNYSPTAGTPPWATHLTVLGIASGLFYDQGVVVGDMRISFGNAQGSVFGPWVQYDSPDPGAGTLYGDRMTFAVGAELGVSGYQGLSNTQVGIDLRRNPTFSVGRIGVQQQTNITLQLLFEERAV